MSVVAHGVDLVSIARIERIWREHGERFLSRVFTDAERVYCLDCKEPATRLAGRFAVKEAVMKALGTGWRGGVEWTDIETLADALGKPVTSLHGRSGAAAGEMGIDRVLVSISHSDGFALASAVCTGRASPPPPPAVSALAAKKNPGDGSPRRRRSAQGRGRGNSRAARRGRSG